MERHSTDAVSLVFGLLFTTVAVVGLTDLLELTEADVRWAGPGLLVLLGIVLVVSAGRRRSSTNGRDAHLASASRGPVPDVSAADVADVEAAEPTAHTSPDGAGGGAADGAASVPSDDAEGRDER